jgi:hypothetical protein
MIKNMHVARARGERPYRQGSGTGCFVGSGKFPEARGARFGERPFFMSCPQRPLSAKARNRLQGCRILGRAPLWQVGPP